MQSLTAIVLCGGRGDRLRPFTDETAKALVPLKGRPILGHLLSYLLHSGATKIVVCVGYRAADIESYIAECFAPEPNIICINSGDVSITDRIIDAVAHVEGRSLICYGDTLANVDLPALQAAHEESSALATLSVYPMHSPFGIVDFAEDRQITGFREKPILPHWINIGFLLCEREALGFLQPGTDMPDFLTALAGAGGLFAYKHDGRHLTVNTEKDRSLAEAQLVEFYTLPNG